MNEIERVIRLYEDAARCPADEYAQIVLAALREQAEREKGCDLCNGTALDGVGIHHMWGSLRVYLACGAGKVPEDEQFTLCPRCGRRRLEVKQG